MDNGASAPEWFLMDNRIVRLSAMVLNGLIIVWNWRGACMIGLLFVSCSNT